MTVIIKETVGEVGIVTLNRPEARNALNLELRTSFQEALEDFDRDPAILAVVLTGAGGNFCAGRDLKAARDGEPMYANRKQQLAAFTRESISKPVIAAVEGYALAGGFELAMSCDLIVASSDAKFGLPEVKRNLVAVGGGLIRLPRRMPYHLAMQLALTGDHFPAQKLADWGVVNVLAEPGEAQTSAVELAEAITINGPTAVRATKEIVRRSFEFGSEPDAFDAQLAIAEPAMKSPDRLEGINSFIERRKPNWTDR